MINRLSVEKSLYLRQHGNNPVHWWPWCKEAFEAAQKANKPVLVSIGYATCHWCHVMAHESFEDPYSADLMNRHYVCIKVDREERPDIDHTYMQAVQMIVQQAGWPLNVFCLPDGRPFFGGTYFPPSDRGHGIVPWPQLLMRIADYYNRNRAELEENASSICKNLTVFSSNPPEAGGISKDDLAAAATTLLNSYDPDNGGFEVAPKFPPSMIVECLLAAKPLVEPSLQVQLEAAITTTLEAMACRGLKDWVGGGFFRYCVDAQWHHPHFEKMLYDNALLAFTYLLGWSHSRSEPFRAVVHETIQWLLDEMLGPDQLFYAAIDADSPQGEGRFYTWSYPEILEALQDPGAVESFCLAAEVPTDTSELKPHHLMIRSHDFHARLQQEAARSKLYAARAKRPRPSTDPKHILAWNCLAIKALALSGFYLEVDAWFEQALRSLDAAWEVFVYDRHRLYSIAYGTQAQGQGFLTDYVLFAEALLTVAGKVDFFYPGHSKRYLEKAQLLIEACLKYFKDEQAGGFFYTAADAETFILRQKVEWDNALPAGSSALVHALATLYALTGERRYAEELHALERLQAAPLRQAPKGKAYAAAGWAYHLQGIYALKAENPDDLPALRKLILRAPYRPLYFQCLPAETAGVPSYTLCKGERCLTRASTLDDIASLLGF